MADKNKDQERDVNQTAFDIMKRATQEKPESEKKKKGDSDKK